MPPKASLSPSQAPSVEAPRRDVQPLDPQITSIQPGGGVCMALELAWGRWRRGYLKRFRPGYVQRMRRLRRGDASKIPHEALDPRDVKFYRNQGGPYWEAADDPFRWRDRLPFARVGLTELLLLGGGFFLLALAVVYLHPLLAAPPAVAALGVVWFFRDPRRTPPQEVGVVLAPADGVISDVHSIDHDEYIGGPAVSIGIFLSVFNVHINRAPVEARVIGLSYRRGKFLNALRPESARENERLTLHLEQEAPPHRPLIVRQITGAIARRIVCWTAPGEQLERGERFGMIKLGSRTELILPRDEYLQLSARPGDRVKAGKSILARYASEPK